MTHSVPHEHFRKILFCTDFSANADRAFIFAVNAARRHTDGQLHLLHVIRSRPPNSGRATFMKWMRTDARAKREIDEKLAQTYLPRVPEDVQLTIAMRIGQAGQKILEYAAEQDIDLIIIGEGTGTVGKIFFGNVSELVVRKAQCPVMVIPPPTK